MKKQKDQVLYPMTFDYLKKWSSWEAIRELVANAQDASPEKWTMTREGNTLVIRDEGAGLRLDHLLLGVSEKANDSAIGQFGEGMKLALMVLTRLNHEVVVYSNDLILTPSRGEKFGHEVLVISYETTESPITGTCIVIDNFKEDYSDRFIFDSDDDRIIFENQNGSVLNQNGLYVKGVYINALDGWRFGYNLPNLVLERDRSIASESDVKCAVGSLWSQVNTASAWKTFFRACQRRAYEYDVQLGYLEDDVREAIRQGFLAVFGPKAALETDEESKREALHRGAFIVDEDTFGFWLYRTMRNIVRTDKVFIEESGGIKPKIVPQSHLTPEQKTILAALRKISKKVGCDYSVVYAELPSNGECDHNNRQIRINVHLDNMLSAKTTHIHELAHAVYGTDDMTEEHVRACCKIGATLAS